MRRARLRAALANLALVLRGLALGLLLAELALRLLQPPRQGGREKLERVHHTEHDPVLRWREKPSASERRERRDYTSAFTVNAHGLRGADRDTFYRGATAQRQAGVARRVLI